MIQIDILSSYEIFPAFEDRASHSIEYNEWGHVSFSIYPINSSMPVSNIIVPLLLTAKYTSPPCIAFVILSHPAHLIRSNGY